MEPRRRQPVRGSQIQSSARESSRLECRAAWPTSLGPRSFELLAIVQAFSFCRPGCRIDLVEISFLLSDANLNDSASFSHAEFCRTVTVTVFRCEKCFLRDI